MHIYKLPMNTKSILKSLLFNLMLFVSCLEANDTSGGGCANCPSAENYQTVMSKVTKEFLELSLVKDANVVYARPIKAEEHGELIAAGFSFSPFAEELNKGSVVQIYRVLKSLKPTSSYVCLVLPPPALIEDPLAVIPGLGEMNIYGANEVVIIGRAGEDLKASVSNINIAEGHYGIMSNEFLKIYSTDVSSTYPLIVQFFESGLEFDVGSNKFGVELLKHAIIASAKK
jgi:hypothetical protein